MNEQLEINGDLRDEWQAIQAAEAAEREEALSEAPVIELDAADLDAWFATWIKENPSACPRSSEQWLRCPDCQGEHY